MHLLLELGLVKLANKNQFIFRQLLIDVEQQYLKPLTLDTEIYKMRLFDSDDTIVATLFESRTNFDSDDENLLLEKNHGI